MLVYQRNHHYRECSQNIAGVAYPEATDGVHLVRVYSFSRKAHEDSSTIIITGLWLYNAVSRALTTDFGGENKEYFAVIRTCCLPSDIPHTTFVYINKGKLGNKRNTGAAYFKFETLFCSGLYLITERVVPSP